jgi:hypothetical protein
LTYLLDTNTFIEAKNRYYRMPAFPGFWEWIDLQFASGQIQSIQMVFEEISRGGDELSDWLKDRKSRFIDVDDEPTQAVFTEIAQCVVDHPDYTESNVANFLTVADPWLIAKAKILGATLVTHETMAPTGSKKVKIPNICRKFEVSVCNTFDMLAALEAQFVLKN